MSADQLHASSDQLDDFLAGTLAGESEEALVRHLDGCLACRRELETAAGEPRWWSDAIRFLSPSPTGEFPPHPLTPSSLDGEVGDDVRGGGLSLDFLAPTDDPQMLGRIGPYEVAGVIGRGGTGIVLKAFERSLNRFVAVKVLAPHLAASAAARKRFEREGQAAAAVVHEHIVPIYAVDVHQGLPYLVMRYVPGRSLQQRLERQGPLGLVEMLRIGQQTAAGLAAAHAHGLVHRDIKPANILLEHGIERVMLTDFGLARTVDDASLTCSGVVAGTPQYMAPEQARGEAIDHRTDLFSLGSVLYAMCAGHSPFRAETTMGILHRICTQSPRPLGQINPETPRWLEQIIRKLHARNPRRRFQSAAEVAVLLAARLAQVQRPRFGSVVPATKTRLRRFRLAIASALAIVTLACLAWRLAPFDQEELALHALDADIASTTSPSIESAERSSSAAPASANEPVSSFAWTPKRGELEQVSSEVDHLEQSLFQSRGIPDGFWAPRLMDVNRLLQVLERELPEPGSGSVSGEGRPNARSQ
ncbi:MAG TPA: protein kinase [Planctomycetaceae bacterium]|nr:protein kinase [Planctomycetaceae bacterium]